MPGLFHGTSLERPVTCERCEKPRPECRCPPIAPPRSGKLPKDQPARVRREKRRGKFMTVIAGLDPDATDLPAMLKSFKATFGAGGTIADSPTGPEIEIQGDHRDAILAKLIAQGYPAKPAGG